MNIVDLVLIGCLVWMGVRGFRAGLLLGLGGLAGIVVAYTLGLSHGQAVAARISGDSGEIEGGAALLGFLLVFVVALALCYVAVRMLRKVLQATPLGVLDAVGGAAIGLTKAVLILGLLLMLLRAQPLHEGIPEYVDRSALGRPVQRAALVLIEGIKALAPGAQKLLDQIGVPEMEGPTPPIVDKITSKADEARQTLDSLVTESRRRLGED